LVVARADLTLSLESVTRESPERARRTNPQSLIVPALIVSLFAARGFLGSRCVDHRRGCASRVSQVSVSPPDIARAPRERASVEPPRCLRCFSTVTDDPIQSDFEIVGPKRSGRSRRMLGSRRVESREFGKVREIAPRKGRSAATAGITRRVN